MSAQAQAIFYLIAVISGLIAAITPAVTGSSHNWTGLHTGWLGFAAFAFVFFWIAVQAA